MIARVGQAGDVRLARDIFALLVCAVGLALIPSGAGAYRWRAPQTLGTRPETVPPLFAGGSNLSVAAWTNSDQSIDVSELDRSGRFGRVRQLRPPSNNIGVPAQVGLTSLAVSPRGDAVLVWLHEEYPSPPPEYSVRSGVTGRWSAPAVFDGHDEGRAGLTVGIDLTGTVTFAWVGITTSTNGPPIMNALRTQVRLPDGRFLPVQTISQDTLDTSPTARLPGYSNPSLSVAGSGAAVVAWNRSAPGLRRQVLYAQRAPGATMFGPPGTLPSLSLLQPDPRNRPVLLHVQAGVDNSGDALLAWLSAASGRAVLLAQRVAADGQLGRLRRLSPPGAAAPALAVNGRGDAVLAWRFYPRRPARVRVAVASAGRGFGRPVTFSAPHGIVFTPDVALDPAGDALVGWHVFITVRRGKERFSSTSSLWSSLRVRGGRFTAPARLPFSKTVTAFGGVTLAPNRHPAIVWIQSPGPVSPILGAVSR